MLLLVGIAILLCSCSNKNAVADAERTVIDFSISAFDRGIPLSFNMVNNLNASSVLSVDTYITESD